MLNVRPQDAVTAADTSALPAPPVPAGGRVEVEEAEAALVEHYPRLVRIAYLVLPPTLGRNRRVLTAHALAQRSLPRGRGTVSDGGDAVVPRARRPEGSPDPGYAFVRERVLRQALEAGLPLRRAAWPRRAQLPPLLPHIWGLRVFPRSGGADELALDQRLSALSGPARAAYVLRGLERLPDARVRDVLAAAGAADPGAALAEADAVPGGRKAAALLDSPEFDPCCLQVRPTDLMRRRRHARAGLVAGAALAVCGALLGQPGGGWGADGAAAPLYARHPAAEAALDPGRLTRVAPGAWRQSARRDFSVWPARGPLVDDSGLLRRALAVWARPGATVRVSATPATPSGPPAGPPQLLFAGEVDGARVVLLHDGLRVARYAEPRDGSPGAALDFARTDGADAASAAALVAGRAGGTVRYLTAPWVREVSVRDLLSPAAGPRPLRRDADGLTAPLPSPAQARTCRAWQALEAGEEGGGARVLTDLGELTPARLTFGPPAAAKDATGPAARASWARTACSLSGVRSHGVRGVNAWEYARQKLPEANGTAAWLCTRAETWRGTGGRVMAQFHAPADRPAAPGTVVARAEDAPSCGVREPRVLAGVLWKSQAGQWYVLAAGSGQFASLTVSGGVAGESAGPVLAVRARAGARAELNGTLADGTRVRALH
ncbi:hypothetical protein ACF08N_14075 [Streptomyces sp. NPDC015127]|uniref:hypothetical protein n=1 Tax=Streptomyces sp. NPDC015127 TaxID=3364939 RepID=UPI0037024C9C